MTRGLFLVMEGIDGSGRSTQLHRLAAWFRAHGIPTLATFEPSTGAIGQLIRRYLRGEEPVAAPPDALALLFAADRLEHLAREVQPALARGEVVLCDRYLASSFAYQGLGSAPEFVRAANARALRPVITLYFKVDPEIALARIAARDGERRELFETREQLTRIAAAYDAVFGLADGPAEFPATVIDAGAHPDAVFEACVAACRPLLTPNPGLVPTPLGPEPPGQA